MIVDLALGAAMIRRVTPRKWTGRPPGRPKGEPREVLLIRIRPDQRQALERLAEKERKARGGKRLDLSRVVRAIIDKALRLTT